MSEFFPNGNPGGAATFATLTGEPGDNAALAAALDARPVLLAYRDQASFVSDVTFDGIFSADYAAYRVVVPELAVQGAGYSVMLTLLEIFGDEIATDYITESIVQAVNGTFFGTRSNESDSLGWNMNQVGLADGAPACFDGTLFALPGKVPHLIFTSIVPISAGGVYSYKGTGITSSSATPGGIRFQGNGTSIKGKFSVYGLPNILP